MKFRNKISAFFLNLLVLFCFSSGPVLQAQQPLSNFRQKKIKVAEHTVTLDTVSIIPSTFKIFEVPATDYTLDFAAAKLFWKKKPDKDSITVQYRVFPFKLQLAKQRLNYDSIKTQFYVAPFVFQKPEETAQSAFFDFGSIKAEGSFGRQIAFGNRQSGVLNSNFNLQLTGMLGDSIELQAAITDNNIPIQPDGTTQQLNEFDQVYIQFRKKGWQLHLGDIDLRQNFSYFLNFYKRLQGISFRNEQRISQHVVSKTLFSASVAKGKFTRNILTPVEGNQGPYRLAGANNEFFFIILANTERVYYDGQLLQRGEDQDYVINYNTAEITFTPRRMITKDSRIQVEFEYADRNYLNSNLYFAQEMELGKKWNVRLGAFQNADARNTSINQSLDNRQKQFLALLGDSIQRAFYPAVTIDSFSADKILYEKVFNGSDSFYRYSTDPQKARYSLSFVDVGQGNGNYVPDFNGANGKVYRYVPPVNGMKMGRFEPVQILVAPRLQQLITAAMEHKPEEGMSIRAELASGKLDVNRFSKLNDGDDRGWAAKITFQNEDWLKQNQALQLKTHLDYEWVQQQFRPLERLRPVEFYRDWGLPLLPFPVFVNENLLSASATLSAQQQHSAGYRLTHYRRSDDYNGFQHSAFHHLQWKGWNLNNRFSLTSYRYGDKTGAFWRPVLDLYKELKKLQHWRFGMNYMLEKNKIQTRSNGMIQPDAFWFDVFSAYLQSDPSRPNRYKTIFFTRSDKYPLNKHFSKGDRSLNLNFQAELLSNPKRQLYLNTTFRKLMVYDTVLSPFNKDQSFLGRAEYILNEWKGLLTGNLLYEAGTGQEQRRDFAFLEVPPGTGQYAWIDYNNDGIRQLNEFELAAFPDQAKFIRVFTPTNEFVKANYITFNYSFQFNPSAVFGRQPHGWKKWLSKIIFNTSMQMNRKSLAQNKTEWNPFRNKLNDTALITLSGVWLNTLSFNRLNPKWGVDVNFLYNKNKSLLTYGYETRSLSDWNMKWRWNVSRSFLLNVMLKKGKNILLTPQFANRNFEINTYSSETALSYIQGTTLRIVTGYRFDIKQNAPQFGNETSAAHHLDLECKYNILQTSSVSGKFTFNTISFPHAANTTVGYIMLDGLLPGNNYLWTLTFTRRLMNNLELNVQYDGRKSGKASPVHLGRAGLTALF